MEQLSPARNLMPKVIDFVPIRRCKKSEIRIRKIGPLGLAKMGVEFMRAMQ